MAIIIGSPAINRPSDIDGYTFINLFAIATGAGFINNVDVWIATGGTVYVGIFFQVGALQYKCRSAASLGVLGAGFTHKTGLALAVAVGDVIGFYGTPPNRIDYDPAGGSGELYVAGNTCVVDNVTIYVLHAAGICSVYGESALLPSSRGINTARLVAARLI